MSAGGPSGVQLGAPSSLYIKSISPLASPSGPSPGPLPVCYNCVEVGQCAWSLGHAVFSFLDPLHAAGDTLHAAGDTLQVRNLVVLHCFSRDLDYKASSLETDL